FRFKVITSENYEDRLPVVLRDRTTPVQVPEVIGEAKLRSYQIKAIEAFLKPNDILSYFSILRMATGSGKSIISAAIAKLLNVKTLFLVRGRALKDQTYGVYKLIFDNEDVGKIDAANWEPSKFTIASVDTLASRLKGEDSDEVKAFLSTIDFVISDEAHTATSQTFMNVLNCITAPVRLGLSGTPLKKEEEKDLLLEAFCGPISHDVPASLLQDEGHLSRATLTNVVIDQPRLDGLDYIAAKDILIINICIGYISSSLSSPEEALPAVDPISRTTFLKDKVFFLLFFLFFCL
ncbi:MAG: DEAD/DEAH box helicase family protein, partial [Candidatus Omnitrophota bacterium]